MFFFLFCCSFSYSYAKAYDPDNWFTVDEETAEIKLNKQPDRESPFLVNGTYIAKILAISKGNYYYQNDCIHLYDTFTLHSILEISSSLTDFLHFVSC